MMKKMLCLLAAVLLSFAANASSEETVKPVTAAELRAFLDSVMAQVLTEAPLNDPAGENAESEDGAFFQYETAGVYADSTELTADTPVNALVFADSEGPVFRGTGIDTMTDDLLAAFPLDNAELAGTREETVLYLRETDGDGFAYGRVLRDGQRIAAVEYGEVVPDGDLYQRSAVTYSLVNGLVSAIRFDGLNPAGSGRMDGAEAEELRTELIRLAGQEEYRAVRTSRNGLELTPLGADELMIAGLSYLSLQPATLPGTPETEIIDNEDGTWLLRCDGDGYEAVYQCGEHGEDAVILSFTILDDAFEGPRGVRIGDLFSEDFNRFRNGENEMTEEMTELLYGTEGTAPYGMACYDPADMNLRYVTGTPDGRLVELFLRYENNGLSEIIIHTL